MTKQTKSKGGESTAAPEKTSAPFQMDPRWAITLTMLKVNAENPETKALLVRDHARELRQSVQPSWNHAVDTLDGTAIHRAAEHLENAWTKIADAQRALDAHPPSSATRAAVGVEVERARRALASFVGPKQYRGKLTPTWNADLHGDAEPESYLTEEAARTANAARVAKQILAICRQPECDPGGMFECLTGPQQDEVLALISLLPDDRELELVRCVVEAHDFYDRVFQGGNARQTAAVMARLDEKESLTNSGTIKASPELLEQIARDKETIEKEVMGGSAANKLSGNWGNDDAIDKVLSHYKTPEERDLFFRELERYNLVDAMIHRGNRKHVMAALQGSNREADREYHKENDESFGAAEATRDAVCSIPSAGLYIGAGFVNAMSIFDPTGMGKRLARGLDSAGDAYSELAGVSDTMELTKGLGHVVGAIEGGLATGAMATEGQAAAATKELVEQVEHVEEALANGRMVWFALETAMFRLPKLFEKLGESDWHGALDDISTGLDDFIDAYAETLGGKGDKKGKAHGVGEILVELIKEALKAAIIAAVKALKTYLVELARVTGQTIAERRRSAKVLLARAFGKAAEAFAAPIADLAAKLGTKMIMALLVGVLKSRGFNLTAFGLDEVLEKPVESIAKAVLNDVCHLETKLGHLFEKLGEQAGVLVLGVHEEDEEQEREYENEKWKEHHELVNELSETILGLID